MHRCPQQISRRRASAALAGACVPIRAKAKATLGRLFGDAHGAAVLLDFRTRRLLAVHGEEIARAALLPPGSTLKPFSLLALIDAGKLRPGESLPCPGRLSIRGRSFACAHPPPAVPLRIQGALAYSCNAFVAHFARRFGPGELAWYLDRAGLSSRTGLLGDPEATGRIERAEGPEANQLQGLGDRGVLVTPLALAAAYHRLALKISQLDLAPILEGLEGAVAFGTAQRAQVKGVTVAGKTGSAGARAAWFAGFAPSRSPLAVVAVLVQGRSGGADAAPIAGRILEAHLGGSL
jgi:penicillin-binding protein 2